MTELSGKVIVSFPCECGGTASVTEFEGVSALVHTMPYCEEFEKLEPEEYLMRNRKRLQRGEN